MKQEITIRHEGSVEHTQGPLAWILGLTLLLWAGGCIDTRWDKPCGACEEAGR